jgi:RNA polymerase sigma factor (sigma-70 family)
MLVTLLEPMLFRVARLYESHAPSRCDLQQDMLIATWLSLPDDEKRATLRTWVHNVAHGVGARHVARRRICRRNERLGLDLESMPNQHDTEALVAIRERALVLHGLLDRLRPREREAIRLELEEFEPSEMSDAMKISKAQVRDTLIRARWRLLKWLRRCETRAPAADDLQARDEPFVRRGSATLQASSPSAQQALHSL